MPLKVREHLAKASQTKFGHDSAFSGPAPFSRAFSYSDISFSFNHLPLLRGHREIATANAPNTKNDDKVNAITGFTKRGLKSTASTVPNNDKERKRHSAIKQPQIVITNDEKSNAAINERLEFRSLICNSLRNLFDKRSRVMGIIDPWTGKPAIRFANDLPFDDGWTMISKVRVSH